MNPIELPIRAEAELQVSAAEVGGDVVLKLVGTADLRVTRQLNEVMQLIHEAAVARNAPHVIVDLTSLEFMNSSCVKAFVTWLVGIDQDSAQAPYRVRFLSNPELLWQRNSLRAIRCMVPDIVSVETKQA